MKILYIDNTILTQDKKFTYLSADASSAGTTLTVQSIVGFAIDKILCIGEPNEEKTEIIKTHAATAPTGSTITLASGLVFDHPQDTKVYIIDYDQAEVSHADTTTGSKSVLSTFALQADQEETQYTDAAKSAGYYFTRFKETIGNTFSGYSDPIPYAGYAANTVWAIKDRALESMGEEISDLITHSFLDEALWDARREYHNAPGKRPFRARFNYDNGNVSTGMYRIAVPSDLEDPSSAKNIFGIRIGTQQNMTYYDKKEWDEDYRDIGHTTLSSAYTVGDTTITLTDSRDFDESGSIEIEGDIIEYSANVESTGVLTISSNGSSAHSADKDIWQNASLGMPTKFTVFPDDTGVNYIYFNRPVDLDYVDQNIWLDYYRTLVAKDSDADELDEPSPVYNAFVNYLAWRIKKRKKKGLIDFKDNDFILWEKLKKQGLDNEYLGQTIQFTPDISHLL